MMLDARNNKKLNLTIQRCGGIFQQFKVPMSSSKIIDMHFHFIFSGNFGFFPPRSFNYIKMKWKIHTSETVNFSVYFLGFQTVCMVNGFISSSTLDFIFSKDFMINGFIRCFICSLSMPLSPSFRESLFLDRAFNRHCLT